MNLVNMPLLWRVPVQVEDPPGRLGGECAAIHPTGRKPGGRDAGSGRRGSRSNGRCDRGSTQNY